MAHGRLVFGFIAGLLIIGCDESGPSGEDAGGTGGDSADGDSGEDGDSADGDSADGDSADDGSTDGDDGEGDDGGGDGGGSLDEVEEACEADCEAQFATECAPPQQNVLTCKLNCAVATVQSGDFCLGEYIGLVQCRAAGGYDCAYDYPTPKATCASEQLTYSECMTDIGCKRSCDDAIEAGCGGDSFDVCLDACIAEKGAFEGICAHYYDSWRLCEAQFGIECVDGQPMTTGDCSYAIASVGECIADQADDVCQGYCFVADELACGGGCSADCASRLADVTCGSDYASLVDCQLRHGDAECVDGRLIGTDICDYENTRYEECLAGSG